MLINIAELTERSGKLYYQSKPYNGGVFYLNNETGFMRTRKIQAGVDVGSYDNGYISMPGDPTYLNSDFLDEGEYGSSDIVTYKGDPYTGFTCDLSRDGKFCEYMEVVENTVRKEDHITFYPSGELRGIGWERDDKGWEESYGWFEDGSISGFSLRIIALRTYFLELSFRQPQQIGNVNLKPEYYDFIAQHRSEFKYSPPIERVEDFERYSASSRLILRCTSITDELIKHLGRNDGYASLNRLSLIGSASLSDEVILSFIDVQTLKAISIDGERDEEGNPTKRYLSLATRFKQQRPDCKITLNGRLFRRP